MTNTTKEAHAKQRAKTAPARKQTVETFKTIVITALVAAIIAFIGGVHYANSVNATKEAAVKATASATALKVKQ